MFADRQRRIYTSLSSIREWLGYARGKRRYDAGDDDDDDDERGNASPRLNHFSFRFPSYSDRFVILSLLSRSTRDTFNRNSDFCYS